MNIHEYQAKEILKAYNVPVLKGIAVRSGAEARKAAETLGGKVWVVKAQIHAGGRGKGGGVKLARTVDEVVQWTEKMMGMNLVTHQTGPEGRTVRTVYIEQGAEIAKEFYLACLIDRATGRATMMASREGGVDIEEVAEKNPEAIVKVDIDPVTGLMPFHARKLGFSLGLTAEQVTKAVPFFQRLYTVFVEKDCAIAEINPLVLTAQGDLLALDCKMNFDSNALFRHPEVVAYRDLNEEDPAEIEASQFDLAFIKLDGNIGCLVNGAGLAMATLDIIKLHGGSPANFLDVGGGANKEKVTAAFKIILKDPNVKGILVNIFGGIMKCDIIAEGVVAASKEVGLKVPLVVRLQGTNVELGKKILSESGLNIVPAEDLNDAAQKIMQAIRGK